MSPTYSQYTLDQFTTQLSVLLDDTNQTYWTVPELEYAVWEALRVFGAYTSYWRARGTFTASPTVSSSPYYGLETQLPVLRTRSWTLGQTCTEIQYMLNEAANGISGSGMSKQVSITSILNAIQRARNRFVIDTRLPFYYAAQTNVLPNAGIAAFTQSAVYVHRAAWQDKFSGVWTNLWREDAWSADHGVLDWPTNSGYPYAFSESELSPLQIQLVPAPSNPGSLEIISVNSLLIDITNAASTFQIPDEYVHAVKYGALWELFSSNSQLTDPLRAQYAALRYQQAVDAAQTAKSIIRLMANNVPLPIDSFQAIDAGMWTWRNQSGPPVAAGVLYDFLAIAPVCDTSYGITADVVQSAPLPISGSQGDVYIQIGAEDIPHLIDYCLNVLLFKCGGAEFQSTFSNYDRYMSAVAERGQINKAKIRYLQPLFEQWNKEERERPDKMPKEAAA